ncbi:MAG: hypothetical protein RR533_05150 [Carnobacterium sp.]
MIDNFQEYESNFSAIMESKKLPEHQKENLLESMLTDTLFIFQEEFKNTKCSEKRKEFLEFISNLEGRLNMIKKKSADSN